MGDTARLIGAGIGGAALLSACERPETPSFDWGDQVVQGVLDFANWPYYIDRTRNNEHPSLDLFTRRSGIDVHYTRPIRGDQRFFEEIRPALAAGRPTGYDLIVITNGIQLASLIRSRWVLPLDHRQLETFNRQASDLVKDPPWDPGNRYSVAWQSGVTGIAYRPEAVDALGRKPASVLDLWSDRLAGRVGMMSDLLDLGSVGLLANGVEPETSRPSDWIGAAEVLERQHDAGIVRGYFDQGYLHALQSGEVSIAQAWSGDIFQARQQGHRELEFIVPDEGGLFWTDNMLIPVHAQHPLDALTFMDFVYQPSVAAMITDGVGYITPVPAVKEQLQNRLHDRSMARSPLIFPPASSLGGESPLKAYPTFRSPEEEVNWQNIFGALLSL